MRKTYSVLLIAAVLLSFGWMRASSAVHQDCCHPSVAKSGSSAALATTSARPMSSLNVEDVRKEFNASSQKVRVVALLSPTCPDCQSGHGVVGRVLKKFPSIVLVAGLSWATLRPWIWIPAFLIMGVGCLVNASRCGRLHCYITGPVFLLAAIYVGLSTMSIVPIRPRLFLFSVLDISMLACLADFPLADTR